MTDFSAPLRRVENLVSLGLVVSNWKQQSWALLEQHSSYPVPFDTTMCACSRLNPGMLMELPSTRGSGNEHLLSAISACYYFGPLTMNEVQAKLNTNHLELCVKGLR